MAATARRVQLETERLILPLNPAIQVPRHDAARYNDRGEIELHLLGRDEVLFVPVTARGAAGAQPGGRYVWSLIQIGSDVWEIMPVVHLPEKIRAFVTIYAVPARPPWA